MSLNIKKISIGFFGVRNSGKSSLINAIANQEVSVVSDTLGTTTDNVKKTMELQPIGPVVLIDTPGIDDEGELGKKRISQTKKILRSCDMAILVTESGRNLLEEEINLIKEFEKNNTPYIEVKNKMDLSKNSKGILVSAKTKEGIEELKNKLANFIKRNLEENRRYVGDLLKEGDLVILVTPIDSGAPKDRLILPQQLAIKDILDSHAVAMVTQVEELESVLQSLKEKPKLVITDSQVFKQVEEILPKETPLTSFSILMARYKGFLDDAYKGAKKIDDLNENSKVLICEGCTHHRQCDDIGTVKIPKLLEKYTGQKLKFEWTSGADFPDNLGKYDLIIHCGGCMLNNKEMIYRKEEALKKNIPFTNYGIVLAYLNNILDRAVSPFTLHKIK